MYVRKEAPLDLAWEHARSSSADRSSRLERWSLISTRTAPALLLLLPPRLARAKKGGVQARLWRRLNLLRRLPSNAGRGRGRRLRALREVKRRVLFWMTSGGDFLVLGRRRSDRGSTRPPSLSPTLLNADHRDGDGDGGGVGLLVPVLPASGGFPEARASLLPLALSAPLLPVLHSVDFAALFGVAPQSSEDGGARRPRDADGRSRRGWRDRLGT